MAGAPSITGNHNDAYNLKTHLQDAFKFIKRLGLDIRGAFFNAAKAFDTKDARKTCCNHAVIPNIDVNKRNRKTAKRGRKRLFNSEVYKPRCTRERSFAWIDKFRAVLVRFFRKDEHFLGAHFIAFSMINLRHTFCE
jgi:transposase